MVIFFFKVNNAIFIIFLMDGNKIYSSSYLTCHRPYVFAGTTWCQEMVWLINNNFDYDTAKEIPLYTRFPFLE